MTTARQLHLGAFMRPVSIHTGAWRYPGAYPDANFNFGHLKRFARKLEAGKFDAFFMADHLAVLNMPVEALKRSHTVTSFEPFTLLSALAGATERIGLVATASTTFDAPYHIARRFASLDHISGGRAGWNIVTTSDAGAAHNFGLPEHPPHGERYEKAREFLDVVTRLWDSWEDDALLADPRSGVFADAGKVHRIDHVGKHYRVRGPLNISRSPQGRPVYVQAGSSEDGRSFAAQFAEAIFTAHQTLQSAQEFYSDIKARAAALGRRPEHLRILPGISPFLGSTQAEAKRLEEEIDDLIQPAASLDQLKRLIGVDLSGYDLDGPVPRHIIDINGPKGLASRFQLVVDIVDRENPTIRQLIRRLAGARGHRVVVGTPEHVANEIQSWFEQGAADGFNVMPPYLTGGFDSFVAEVVPILRKRGLFRQDYSGATLRDHFGLPRPDSLFAAEQRKSA